ncbi:IucA/IucC family protein [Tuberibacillus sp. Marseille-P3662]|uniref:IucA/IucC family protein n=1 Tax=Tuberibacillus sp. Marseille-P3662 TaxID=1965358 RepID=UPI000A1CCF1F|nr:IucA/IucC family siderophore biosynthesis protein [Tuberibacillus sp. Marseille-P3662]
MDLKTDIHHHLTRETWMHVNQQLIAKMMAEYMYEAIIHPNEISQNTDGTTTYLLTIDSSKSYRFSAYQRLFDSFDVVETSVEVKDSNRDWESAKSTVQFLTDIQPLIGMSPETTGHLIREINHTLMADAFIANKATQPSETLVDADYSDLEGEMTGHPWITYNKGRIGFGYDDYRQYAPEAQKTTQLYWIAVSKSCASYQSVNNLQFEELLEHELAPATIESFNQIIHERGWSPHNYFYLPVHEWQWQNMIIQNYPEDIAMDAIIALGTGDDAYLPQQSIRTFVNQSHQHKHHVKLPMSILNTLVYRGLPSERTVIAPQITDYIKGIYEQDSFLNNECKVVLPGEIASIDYQHPYFSQVDGVPYQYLEMLGCIWRESIYRYLEAGEQPITLAALLHKDQDGTPYICTLIEKSGLSADEWIKQMFKVIMPPLLHFLYQYGTVFSPHGQNTILVLKDYQPARLAVKDFVDDVNVSDQPLPELEVLSDDLKSVLRQETPEGLTQFIITGLFICHFRYLVNLLERHQQLREEQFWGELRDVIENYQARFPHLKQRFETFDLFQPQINKLCLNRNRMIDDGYSDGDDRPHASEHGTLTNALSQVQKVE